MRNEVIVARATGAGRSAIAVVRLSGPDLVGLIDRFVRCEPPLSASAPGRLRRVVFVDADGPFDDGLAWIVPSHRTYTGEPSAELSCHGNPLIVERLVHAAVVAGARPARPGEFTRRALLSGRIDRVAAEAVEQTIHATTPRGLAVARAGLDGRLTQVFAGLRREIVDAVAELEARLDYPDDELALTDDDTLCTAMIELADRCAALAATESAGRRLVEGARVALVGPVNAGKSSLFNALVGSARALVSPIPGTTRDVVEARARIGDLDVTLLDTAGERETDDPIEAAGLALARDLVDGADLILLVTRVGAEQPAVEAEIAARLADRPLLRVANGVDAGPAPDGWLGVSARQALGIDELRAAIARTLAADDAPGALLIASAHQRDRLLRVSRAARAAVDALPYAGVAVAAEALTEALAALDELTGVDTRESVLDALFARFCIGK